MVGDDELRRQTGEPEGRTPVEVAAISAHGSEFRSIRAVETGSQENRSGDVAGGAGESPQHAGDRLFGQSQNGTGNSGAGREFLHRRDAGQRWQRHPVMGPGRPRQIPQPIEGQQVGRESAVTGEPCRDFQAQRQVGIGGGETQPALRRTAEGFKPDAAEQGRHGLAGDDLEQSADGGAQVRAGDADGGSLRRGGSWRKVLDGMG